MDEPARNADLHAAMTTEHFVLQSANGSTYAEASARSSLYIMALSSSLVALGFLSSSAGVLLPFAAILLPAVFVLGLFTVVRLVETSLESMHYLTGIARIRAYYRSLGPEAARHFAAEAGRWPEASSPALRLGPTLAFMGTTASMIATTNNVVVGTGAALLARLFWPSAPTWVACAGRRARRGRVDAGLLRLPALALQRLRSRRAALLKRARGAPQRSLMPLSKRRRIGWAR